jgi:hypothetical protein
MSLEDYERLRANDPRRVYRTGETPDDLATLILDHFDKAAASGDAE